MRILPTILCFLLVATLSLASAPPTGTLTSVEGVRLPEGRWAAPVPSPDGRFLTFTAVDFRWLEFLDLESGKVTTLSESRGAGFRAIWSEDSTSIAFRTSTGEPTPKLRIVVAHPDGTTETASKLERSLSLPVWQGSALVFARFDAETPVLQRVGPDGASAHPAPPVASPDGRLWLPAERGEGFRTSPSSDKVFFLPVPSPDGRRFVTECLDGHLYLGTMTGERLEDLGPGSYPSFVRGGTALLFERTTDDGHRITGSDLFLVDLKTREVEALTATPDRSERHPKMAGDGHTLYFEEDGRILKGWVP